MEVNAKEFSNKDITITYDPCICSLSGTCAKGLSDVFSNSIIPWINLDNNKTERIIEQVKKCPSGALQFFVHEKQAS